MQHPRLAPHGYRRGALAGPILLATVALLALVGLLTLPSYMPELQRPQLSARGYAGQPGLRRSRPALLAGPDEPRTAAGRDRPRSCATRRTCWSSTESPSASSTVPGICRVQAITRPAGTPIEHTSIPFLISMQGTTQHDEPGVHGQDRHGEHADAGRRHADVRRHDDARCSASPRQMAATTHSMVSKMQGMTVDVAEMRDHIADFDDFLRPIRNYLYWEPHCFDIPMCWSMRSVFDTLDGIDTMTDDIQNLMPDMERLDALMPQMVAMMPPMIETMKSMKNMMLTMYQSQNGRSAGPDGRRCMENQGAMGQAFDASKNDDSFYLPPEVFDNADFKRGMKMFLSPDGQAVRFIICHEGDPGDPRGDLTASMQIKNAAYEAIKGTPLEGLQDLPRRVPRPPTRTCRKAPTTTC